MDELTQLSQVLGCLPHECAEFLRELMETADEVDFSLDSDQKAHPNE
jgi:hypothetical protein